MANRSASDAGFIGAAIRDHVPAPRIGARRAVAGAQRPSQVAQPVLGLFPVGSEALRLPDLELVALADEGHPVADPGMLADGVGEDHPPLAVVFEDLAFADQGRRQIFVILREGLEIGEARPDDVAKAISPGVDRLAVQGRAAVDSVETVHRQHRPERRGYRHPPLGVEPICEGRNELVHSPRLPHRAARHPARSPPKAAMGPSVRLRAALFAKRLEPTIPKLQSSFGITWDIMGFRGPSMDAVDCAVTRRPGCD